jgi:hypothetical protein
MQLHFRGELAFVTATLTHRGTTRIEPFDVVPLDVASWWPPAAPDRVPR